jgi:NAD(P)-dependent dehydrogenase (short-subunit alcohol dehydrogenase family)
LATEPDRSGGAKRLKGKVCIVTGAGQGIGRATANRLGQEGGKIVIAERVDESAERVLADLRGQSVDAIKVLADVSKLEQAKQLVAEATETFGTVDVLVNCVGGTIWWQPFHEYTEEQIQLELERNLYPTLWCCSAVLPVMMSRKYGSIINVGSQVTRGGLYRSPYAVGKGGVIALTRVLSREYGPYNIRVNVVSPGGTRIPDRITPRTQISQGIRITPGPKDEAYRKEVTEESIARQALKRSGLPEEQASAIAFLASDDASFITGQIVNCSGEP